jgi:hypothetical protein
VLNALLDRNPRAPNAWTQKARLEAELGFGADSVLATLGRGLQQGEDRGSVAQYARGLGRAASTDSMAPNKLVAMRTAIRYYRLAQSAQASDTTTLALGYAQVELARLLSAEPPGAKRCDIAKEMSAALVEAQIALPKAGPTFPQAVATLMTAAGKLATYAEELTKAVCR